MFILTADPIVPPPLDCPDAGGFVAFDGRVRNHADGRAVLKLEYEAYPELALTEGNKLVDEAKERFGLLDATVIHRTGALVVGESAVLIHVAAAHRREAFAGCEWIIDQLKVRVPIWKRETYADGDSGWIGADALSPDTAFDAEFFRRQLRLPEVGPNGQDRLQRARVLLVGVGGLGSASLPALVSAGVGTLGLVDPDEVEVSNLHRQTIYQAQDVGRSKVERAMAFALRLRPGVTIEAHPVRLTAENVDTLVSAYDWVIDGTDSLRVKALLNAACRRHQKPFITASVHRFEGQILTVLPDGPCLNCLFPTLPSDSCVGTCAEDGILGVVPSTLGLMQANELLKGILGYGELLSHRLLLTDLRTGETTSLARAPRPHCPGCRGELPAQGPQIEFETLAEAARDLGRFRLIDLREPDETPALAIPHDRVPMSSFTARSLPSGPNVFVCASGIRSRRLVEALRESGHEDVYTLSYGLKSL